MTAHFRDSFETLSSIAGKGPAVQDGRGVVQISYAVFEWSSGLGEQDYHEQALRGSSPDYYARELAGGWRLLVNNF